MTKPRILHLETATNICSVALSEGGNLVAVKETDEDRSHGSVLTVFMDEVLREGGLSPSDIDAVAVSLGPGSYTGLRIGVSVTKGFAYAQDIPVIGISTLRLLTAAALCDARIRTLQQRYSEILLCPMIDARRMEVYTAVYSEKEIEIEAVTAKIIDDTSFNNLLKSGQLVFFGNGSDKIAEIIRHKNAHIISGITPSAKYMLPLALQAFHDKKFEDRAYFEPLYLKDFIATTPKKKLF